MGHDEDGTPPHADADEPGLIAMPPAPASAPLMSNLERCHVLRLVTALDRIDASERQPPASSQRLSLLSHVSPCFHILTASPSLPDSDSPKTLLLFSFIVAVVKHGPSECIMSATF